MGVIGKYFPYFRGKQYELIAIRESARQLAKSEFIPIIEPVRESTRGLDKAIDAVSEADGQVIVLTNPNIGDYKQSSDAIADYIKTRSEELPAIIPGMLLRDNVSLDPVSEFIDSYPAREIALIHSGFGDPKGLRDILDDDPANIRNVFMEQNCGMLYRKRFSDKGKSVLLRDGFKKRKNREYPSTEFFSELHLTYRDEGVDGFGDFLIVGDEYSETGGPAYAIAIHLSYIDANHDDEMWIRHFVSDRFDTPSDPAGKFAEAVSKLANVVEASDSMILRTAAVNEFLELHNRGHFPGLGYVKKLSMLHHIETMARFFESST